MTRYVFDRKKFINAIQPMHINKLLAKLELSPSQQITFWKVEPNIDRLLQIRKITKMEEDILSLVEKTGKRYPKKEEE